MGVDGLNGMRPLPSFLLKARRASLTLAGRISGGFELHIGSITFGCINANKTNPQAVQQYHDLQRMLQFEDGSNFLTVVP